MGLSYVERYSLDDAHVIEARDMLCLEIDQVPFNSIDGARWKRQKAILYKRIIGTTFVPVFHSMIIAQQ